LLTEQRQLEQEAWNLGQEQIQGLERRIVDMLLHYEESGK
jgi:hypothetical protein